MVDNNKDDNAFDDADFEDLDPIEDDDLGDDGWDDDLSGTEASEPADSDPETGLPKEKTFVQKNFMLIVGAIVVVFGGVIGVSLLGGGSPAPMPDEQAAAPGDALPEAPLQAEYEDGADMPPMPAPINPGEENADGALTPMPTPADLENAELGELSVDEVPAQPTSGTTPQGEEPFDYRSNDQREASDEPAPKNAAEKLNAEFANRAETAPAVAPVTEGQPTIIDSEGNMLAMPAPVLADNRPKPPELAAEEPAPNLAPQLEAQKTEIGSLQSKLDTEAARAVEAEKSAQALQQELDSKTSEIEALSKKVAELEQKLVEAESAPAPAAEEPTPAPKKAAQPKAETPKAASSATPKAPATQQASAEPKAAAKPVAWELKAAQPGKAVLFSKATGDTRNVAVGDTVEGLGKIASISNETGRWTVLGSRGQVSR
ncbi:MAG: hypothetical protein WBK55_07055 [Alphaproteobacteria bacterium]